MRNGQKLIVAIAMLLGASAAMADSYDDGLTAFIQGDMTRAYGLLLPLAENGHPEAQYHIGYMYRTGTGVKMNEREAIKWYSKAAKQGHATAFYQVNLIKKTQ